MWIHQEETKRISYIDQLEIQISDGGYVEVGPEWYGIRECSPFSRLYYINGGKAWAQSGDETLEFTEGHMALIPLWHPYPHGCVESFQHLYFHFNLTKAGGLDLFSSLKQILILPMDKQAIAHMIQLYNSRNPADALTLTSFLLRDINTFISLGVSTGAMTYAYSETTEKVVRLNAETLQAEAEFSCAALDVHGKRVLLVEDNELNREISHELLTSEGFEVEEADDGDVAIEKVKNSAPGYFDLVLMDVQMPRMNGYDAARAIRALDDKSLAQIPIIAVTANAFEEDRRAAISAGMNGHIAKPIDVRALRTQLANFV